MKLIQINYALKLAEIKNFSKAAEHLFITQPTLSQQIKLLEDEIGTPLFIRERKAIRLTPAGIDFIENAKDIMYKIDSLTKHMEKYKSPIEGYIRIGLLWSFGYIHLDSYIKNFELEYPLIETSLSIGSTKQLLTQLNNDELDIAFVNMTQEQLDKTSLSYFRISESEVCALMHKNHHLSDQKFISIKDLDNEPVLMASKETQIYTDIEALLQASKINPKIIGYSGQIDVCAQFATAGLGISFLSKEMASYYSDLPIIAIPITPTITRYTYIVYRKKYFKSTIKTFIQYLSRHDIVKS